MAEIGLFEAMYSARSLRKFKPDPVPDEVIGKILDAAIRAPSGSNEQGWEFMVVKDAAQRKKIGEVYRKGGDVLKALYTDRVKPPHMSQETYDKLMASAMYLIDHMADAPVLLIACLKQLPPSGPPPKLPPEAASAMKNLARMTGSSIYPAVQNIILACRALGLGTVLTTIHMFYEDELKAILGMPPEVQTFALMPIGYPQGKFGPIKRRPASEVAYLDHYGNHWKA
ncbi:MAG: nitroreductase family protein [Candidatus Binatus sp.]|uniref:nitroreductase family protein n=1 Tax=Candidatus Binatus sp. TaxID=2811406 RepID=UPI002726CFD4|nr:nitroreductase family protein [Candidatus Binatus sp.]MDO8434302.1 nitroreductase family protein [Candidatus Binatus sp.]